MKLSTIVGVGVGWLGASLALPGGAQVAQVAPVAQARQVPQNPSGPQALYIRSLAATCANCHGTEGRAVPDSSIASLAGLSKDFIVVQMTAFKNGSRPATVMHQLSKGYSDAQIETIASYFAAQKK